MNATVLHVDKAVFGGLLSVIAGALSRATRSQPGEGRREVFAASLDSGGAQNLAHQRPDGRLHRLAGWFWRQKRHGVQADLARSKDIFESLDRWLWKQQMRETEAYLAQSKDIFELEARMRRLERGPSSL